MLIIECTPRRASFGLVCLGPEIVLQPFPAQALLMLDPPRIQLTRGLARLDCSADTVTVVYLLVFHAQACACPVISAERG